MQYPKNNKLPDKPKEDGVDLGLKITNEQHLTSNVIIDLVSQLATLNEQYPTAVAFALNSLMPERSFGTKKARPSSSVMRNKILAEVILQDDLREQEVFEEVNKARHNGH